MKKVLAIGMLVAAMAAAGCGGSTPAPKAADTPKAPVADQVSKMKEEAAKLVEQLDTVKEKAAVTVEKVEAEIKKVEALAKENGVEQKDVDAVKAKLQEAMAKLKKK